MLGLRAAVLEEVRVLAVAGSATGVVVAGVLSRPAMGLLRVTSPDVVIGVTSDDGSTIGQVTLGGTYALLALVIGPVVDSVSARDSWTRRGLTRTPVGRCRLLPTQVGVSPPPATGPHELPSLRLFGLRPTVTPADRHGHSTLSEATKVGPG